MQVRAEKSAIASPGYGGLEAQELETLLSRESDAGVRQALLTRLVANAQAGNGKSAFYLGALYRSGKDHPARLVDREADTARYWLEKCVDSQGCPLLALASLAELELATGDSKAAMQWAQAWVALEREMDSRKRADDPYRQGKYAPYQHTSYHAYLLERCYQAMPGKKQDRDALGLLWFNELRARRGKRLDAMLFATIDESVAPALPSDLEISAQNQRSRKVFGDTMQPSGPAMGLYIYKGSPKGGRGEQVRLVEGWPTPMAAHGLDILAREIRMKPYVIDPPEKRLYAELPVSFNNWDYTLMPTKK
ncbi:MAG: hypothetical protein ABWZ08_00480 [Pseudoxanthomonas sp.]